MFFNSLQRSYLNIVVGSVYVWAIFNFRELIITVFSLSRRMKKALDKQLYQTKKRLILSHNSRTEQPNYNRLIVSHIENRILMYIFIGCILEWCARFASIFLLSESIVQKQSITTFGPDPQLFIIIITTIIFPSIHHYHHCNDSSPST